MPETSPDPIPTRHSLLNRLKDWGDQASSDDTGSTGPMERVPDPAGVALDAMWQEEWEKHLMTAALARVKQQVSPRQYQMFDLHVLQKLSVQETARMLQASVASVYMAKHRVARLVKKEIQKSERTEV